MGSNIQFNRMYKLFFRMSRTIRSLIQLKKLIDFLETGSSKLRTFQWGLERER